MAENDGMIGQEGCPFCGRIAREEYDGAWLGGVHFEPLNPITPGHRLFVTREHESPLEDPFDYMSGMSRAQRVDRGLRPNPPRGVNAVLGLFHAWRHEHRLTEPYNLILNAGAEASQTIEHLHLHYVPRREGDGLVLPWTGQER